ncbi:class I SAM-dependent methyltransferase [Isosphaeraceae bacterium EP7]
MRDDYARAYAELARRHWWWRSRQALVLKRLAALPRLEGARILDVGCGAGVVLDALANLGEAEGLEPDARLAAEATHPGAIRVVPFGPEFRATTPYDLVVMLDVLEHLDDDLGSLKAARSALAPGGWLLLTVPAMPSLWSRHDVVNEHRRRYRMRDLAAVIEGAGLRVVDVRHAFAWTVGPLLARRWLAPATDESEYRVSIPPRPINAALDLLSRLDHSIGRLVRWPVGGSLIALARRDDTPDSALAEAA